MLKEYKCPCCGGAIEFDSSIQAMKCPYCDTEFEMETLLAYDEELSGDRTSEFNWNVSPGKEWQEGENGSLYSYICNSCGGEIVGDETLGATHCPFCSNPVIMTGQFAGALKPDIVIPFKLDKKAAKEALKKHYMGKRLLPKSFKDENHIEEVKGVYVPFWLFDTDANARIRYKATRVRVWSDSTYRYTETSFFNVTREGSLGFEGVPVDGSTKMDDALMESVEPFNLSEAVDFQTAYLSGYLAHKYDVDENESIKRANERIQRSTEEAFAATVEGYTTVLPEASSVDLSEGRARYALYPLWILNTQWGGEKYIFAMNGQTGKFVGDLPMDKKAFKKWLFGIWGIASAAIFAIGCLISLIG
ncbi:MAG: hypothetical protein IJA52_01435 [Clostridia bacterium]|nr:hypothetical protein [Clostridia bacterium]